MDTVFVFGLGEVTGGGRDYKQWGPEHRLARTYLSCPPRLLQASQRFSERISLSPKVGKVLVLGL